MSKDLFKFKNNINYSVNKANVEYRIERHQIERAVKRGEKFVFHILRNSKKNRKSITEKRQRVDYMKIKY